MATMQDLETSQTLQDKGITKEFQNVHRILAEEHLYMEGRFNDVEGRFNDVDVRFNKMGEEFGVLNQRIQVMQDTAMNSKSTERWQDIIPIAVSKSGSGYQIPPNFPNKVLKFWHLQRPPNLQRLVDFLRFYDIRLDTSDDTDESETESHLHTTLEEAVKVNPRLTLRCLADRIGLDFAGISHNLGLVEVVREITAQNARKHIREEDDEVEEHIARRTNRPGQNEPKDPPQKPQQTSQPASPEIKVAAAMPSKMFTEDRHFEEKTPSQRSHVSWAVKTPPPGPKFRFGTPEFPHRTSEGSEGKPSVKSPKKGAVSQASCIPTEPLTTELPHRTSEGSEGNPSAKSPKKGAVSPASYVLTEPLTTKSSTIPLTFTPPPHLGKGKIHSQSEETEGRASRRSGPGKKY